MLPTNHPCKFAVCNSLTGGYDQRPVYSAHNNIEKGH